MNRSRASAVGLLLAAFGLRLAFGLASDFRTDDPLQIYLIGLEFFTTGRWPYFGPDVVYTRTQIPGGLQGLLVGGPLWILQQPEAPYLLLNLLSFGSLVLLITYLKRRVPGLPAWFLWPWVLFSPWTLSLSTNVVNPSYVLTGSILVFVGVFELIPALSGQLLRPAVAFFMTGFGLLWVAQLHLSYPLLLPCIAIAFVIVGRRDLRTAMRGLVWFSAGALVAGSTLVPTLVAFGLRSAASTGANIKLTPDNLLRLPEVTARFLSFASFELPRFIGNNTAARLAFLGRYPWAAPFAVFAGLCGLVQPFVLLLGMFWRRGDAEDWIAIRRATLGLLSLVYVSFALSVKDPASHTFYLVLPVVMVYSFYCWRPLLERPAWRYVAAALLVSGFVTHLAIAIDTYRRTSLYTMRPLVATAIRDRNARLVGERRPETWAREQSR